MKTHVLFRKYFERTKKASPGFSLRSLARRLGVSPSYLSRMLSGQREIPEKLVPKLAKALSVEPEILAARPAAPRRRRKPVEVGLQVEDWSIAANDAQAILRAWHFVPILELTTLPDFDGSADQIARRLNLSAYATEMALHELQRLGLLEKVDGKFRKKEEKLRITASRPNPLIRRFHDEMMERAQLQLRRATSEADLERRLISGITLTASPKRVQDAKRRLSECLHEIANELLSEPGTEVYQLAVQLFPLTTAEAAHPN